MSEAFPSRGSRSAPLCRCGGGTCGGCCWGAEVDRPTLERRLRRHRRIFGWLVPAKHAAPWRLLLHEIGSRRGLDVVLGVALFLPGIAGRLRDRLQRSVVCAFLAFEDESEERIGCLLHPSRWNGVDLRTAAFRWFHGFACGTADYLCSGARHFQQAPVQERRHIRQAARRLDWYDFSKEAPVFHTRGSKELSVLPISPPELERV